MLGSVEGTVTIGALPLVRTILLPRAINAILDRYPGIQIRTVESPYETLIARLLAGDIDFVLGALRPVRRGDELETEDLFEEPIALVARAGHPLARLQRITAEHLNQAEWALSRQGSPTRTLLADSFAKMGMTEPVPVLETGDLAVLRGVLLETDLITAISAQQLRHEIDNGQLVVLDFEMAFTHRHMGITTRRQSIASPVAKITCEEIRRQVGWLAVTPWASLRTSNRAEIHD